jgi:hypothetical protein
MVKVSIKKNIKPKKVTIKKTIKPKKKENKDQTQTQNVIVNVNETITKKKRGRPAKRSKIEKQTTKPASQQPITQSYNQPIFKQSTPQPSTLTSSILASQNIPKVIKEEVKEESALRKALIEQNLSTAEDPIEKSNDLERVRNYKPKVEVKKEEPIRHGLFSQILSDQGDDTEEIQQLKKLSKPSITAFKPFGENELIPLKTTRKEPVVNPLTSFSQSTEPVFLTPENKQPNLFTTLEENAIEPDLFSIINDIPTQEEIIADEEAPIENPLTSQQQDPTTTILEENQNPPKITESLQAEEVRPADQYTTEQIVKGEESTNGIPIVEASLVTVMRSKQIESKWKELNKAGGPLEGTIGGSRRKSNILLDEIHSIEPSWNITPTGKKPGKIAKPKPVVETNPITPETKVKRGRPKRNNLVEEI